jgi:hypothetical protein
VLTVALASGISGIESVVATGSRPANVKAIKDFAPTATVFFVAASGEVISL